MMMFPLARTPMDKKSSQAMNSYQKKVQKMLDEMLPWKQRHGRLQGLRAKYKPGVTVLLDPKESEDNKLFKGANIKRA